MNKIITSIVQLGLIGSLLSTLSLAPASAQPGMNSINNYLERRDAGKNVSFFHRVEVGYGLTYGSANLIIQDRQRDGGSIVGNSRTTSFNYRAMSGSAAVYFPITYTGKNTMLALNTGIYFTGSIWQLGNTSLNESTVTTYETAEVFYGFPVGVDFIYGGEATFNKVDKVTLRGGAGVMPYFAVGGLPDNSLNYAKFGIKPYIKGEIGFFAGVEWKLRGMIEMGTRTAYDYKVGDYYLQDSDYYYSMNFKLQPRYTVGFSVFPFSFGWENDKW